MTGRAEDKPWRVGRKVGRTIYEVVDDSGEHDTLIGVMDTRELAADAVAAHNASVDPESYDGSFQQLWRYAAAEVTALRKGLEQIVEDSYPAEAGDAATWAAEVLADPAVVHWEEADA